MKTQVFKGETLSKTKVKNNILRIWEQADSDERRDWYKEANCWATNVATTNNLEVSKVCGVIASLSPVKQWKSNLKCAEDLITIGDCGHMKQFKNKAIAIVNSDGSDDQILSVLNGNKISAFYVNIRYPEKNKSVTIDRHALSIALGRWVTDEDYRGMTDKQYEFFVSCYVVASEKVNVTPLLMQSATWVKWRKIKSNYRN